MAMNMNPKELRAQAKQLLELARTIEMTQDPAKYMKSSMNKKVAGIKRKMKYDLAKSFSGAKK